MHIANDLQLEVDWPRGLTSDNKGGLVEVLVRKASQKGRFTATTGTDQPSIPIGSFCYSFIDFAVSSKGLGNKA